MTPAARHIPSLAYVTDGERGTAGRPQADVIEAAARGGVDAVILRLADADGVAWSALLARILPLRASGLRILASRRLDVARAFDLDGVHLAEDAVPVAEARRWLGPDACIGYSAHDVEEARRVAREGASYVTLSPIHSTDSKPGAKPRGVGWLAGAAHDLPVPVLALGGMTPERAARARAAGAAGVAVVSAIGAAPDPETAAREFRNALLEETR